MSRAPGPAVIKGRPGGARSGEEGVPEMMTTQDLFVQDEILGYVISYAYQSTVGGGPPVTGGPAGDAAARR